MSTTSKPTFTSRSPTPSAPPTMTGSPLPRAPPFWTSHFGQSTTAESQPTSTSTYTENPDTTQWTISTRTPTRISSTITSMRLSTETEGIITTSTSSELYPSTSTSEIISPTTSLNSTTTDSTTPIPSSTTTEPYPPSSSTTTITTTTTTSSSTTTTTTTWSYTRPTTTTSVGPTIPPTPPPSNDSGNLSTGAIVGIAVASVVGILALVLSGLFIRRRRQRSGQRGPMYYQNPPPMQETRHSNHGGGGRSGGLFNNNNNNGTGLGITISSVNDPYSGNDFRISQDQMNAASMDTGGGFSSQSSGSGYDNVGSATALGAGLYGGYDNDYRYQQQALHQQRSQQPFYPSSNNQPLSYTPPTEPDIAPEDRYDPTYASRREQEAAYMNYQQQQLYLQSQQQLQQQQLQQQQQQRELIQQQRQQKQQQYLAGQLLMPAPLPTATTDPFDTRPTVIGGGGGQEGYYPENRFSINSQTYLERLRGSYPPATIDQGLVRDSAEYSDAGSVVVNSVKAPSPGLTPPLPPPMPVPVPPISSSHVGAGAAADRMAGSEDYAYPESDARRVPNNDRWSSPPSRPTSLTTHTSAVTVQTDDQLIAASTTEGELTPPPMANRFAGGGGGGVTAEGIDSNVVSPRRSSVLSQASVSTASSGLNHKRLHSPHLIPSPK